MNHDTTPKSNPAAYHPWAHRVALAAAVLTWPLLIVGGTVTVLRAGMAVPDWPTTFGINMFLYNMADASLGVLAEHSHRLYGSAVGMACLGLATGYTLARLGRRGVVLVAVVLALSALAMINPVQQRFPMPRPGLLSMAALGLLSLPVAAYFGIYRKDLRLGLTWLALAAVVGQGVLGGYRVNLVATDLAFVHGSTAQAFFALMTVVVVVTGRRWIETTPEDRRPDPAKIRLLSTLTVAIAYGQVVAGAYVRHYVSSVGLIVHAVLALAVVAHAALLATRVGRLRVELTSLWPSARMLAILAAAQVGLGLANWWTHPPFDGIPRPQELTAAQALIRLGHQGVGALLLASSVVLALRSARLLTSPKARPVAATEPLPDDANPAARRDLEPVG